MSLYLTHNPLSQVSKLKFRKNNFKWAQILSGACVVFSCFFQTQSMLAQDDVSEPGIINTFSSKLPVALWNDDDSELITERLVNARPGIFSEINKLRIALALSSSTPRLSKDAHNMVFAGRLNLLYNFGMIDGAEALAQQVDWFNVEVRRMVEPISLLSSRPENYCTKLLANQFAEIQPGMKIYCFVRDNNWPAAQRLFDENEYQFDEVRRNTLERFLFSDENIQSVDEPWKELPRPIDFVIDESFGRPRGEAILPPAYAYFVRELGTNNQSALELTEDLTRSSSLPANVAFSAYRHYTGQIEREASQRAQLIQNLESDFDLNTPKGHEVISEIYYSFSSAALLDSVAPQLAPYFNKTNFQSLNNASTRNTILRIALLGGWSQEEWREFLPRNDADLMLAFNIRHENSAETVTNLNSKSREILSQVDFEFQRSPADPIPSGLDLIYALDVIENYFTADTDVVVEAFQALIKAGQREAAKNIAISLLFGRISA